MTTQEITGASRASAPLDNGFANLLADGQALSPGLNMAIDSWMAERAPLISGQAILRIYRWSPAGISIGRNQSWERALDIEALGAGEIAVRRVTGGRAIYHDSSELTYSIVVDIAGLESGDKESESPNGGAKSTNGNPVVAQRHTSGLIVASLLRFLRGEGMDAKVEKRSGYVPALCSNRNSPHCFVSTARHELTVAGCKIVASAQRVSDGRFFQHGSIKISGVMSHPALYGRSGKSMELIGNNSPLAGCYTIGSGVTAGSQLPDPHASYLHVLEPDELRSAFVATFGAQVVSPTLTPPQWDEVLRRMADNDSIVGSFERRTDFPGVRAADERQTSFNSLLPPHV
jgi:lipoate-protein ligase A